MDFCNVEIYGLFLSVFHPTEKHKQQEITEHPTVCKESEHAFKQKSNVLFTLIKTGTEYPGGVINNSSQSILSSGAYWLVSLIHNNSQFDTVGISKLNIFLSAMIYYFITIYIIYK